MALVRAGVGQIRHRRHRHVRNLEPQSSAIRYARHGRAAQGRSGPRRGPDDQSRRWKSKCSAANGSKSSTDCSPASDVAINGTDDAAAGAHLYRRAQDTSAHGDRCLRLAVAVGHRRRAPTIRASRSACATRRSGVDWTVIDREMRDRMPDARDRICADPFVAATNMSTSMWRRRSRRASGRASPFRPW